MFARRLYAHRGASAERPENTMPAFERAVEAGADALEMDVHLTRDGHLVVAHDDTALRTTGVPKPWTEMDLDEVGRGSQIVGEVFKEELNAKWCGERLEMFDCGERILSRERMLTRGGK